MGGWMNGQVEGEKIDGWMDEWIETGEKIDEWMDEQIERSTERKQMGEWMNGQVARENRWVHG